MGIREHHFVPFRGDVREKLTPDMPNFRPPQRKNRHNDMPTILTAKERDTVLEKSETFLHREIGVGFLD